jgi:hypothetical protein
MGVSGGQTTAKNRSTTSVRIPKFLRPLARQGAATSQDALTSLTGMLNNGDGLIADFTGAQDLSHMLGVGRALGGGGFFPTAQDTFLDTAQGGGLDLSFLPPEARSALASTAAGGGLDFLPPDVLARLSAAGTNQLPGTGVLGDLSTQSGIPQGVESLLTPGGVDTSSLQGILDSGAVSPEVREALQSTARGDFLAGGQGFDAAVEAAVRAAKPAILSTFGRAGAGGATGGLAQTAIGTAAIDAFARQFANERSNQLGAAGRLADLGLAERGQNAGVASTLADIGLTERGQGIDAGGVLGQLGLADTGQQGDFAETLASLGLSQGNQELSGLNSLATLFGDERGRQLGSAELLAGFGENERTNQLNAAQMLPGLATADLDLLESIGLSRQNQNQRQISAPIEAQLQLLMAAMGVPSSMAPFLGSGTSNRSFSQYGNFSMGMPGMGG